MVQSLAKEPSTRLLKHVVRCYLRLSDNLRLVGSPCSRPQFLVSLPNFVMASPSCIQHVQTVFQTVWPHSQTVFQTVWPHSQTVFQTVWPHSQTVFQTVWPHSQTIFLNCVASFPNCISKLCVASFPNCISKLCVASFPNYISKLCGLIPKLYF